MALSDTPSSYQVNKSGNARNQLSASTVEMAIDEVNGRRVRLMERLAEVILDPTEEDKQKRSTRCEAKYSDHIIIQALMMTAKHCRDLPAGDVTKTAALQALCKVTLEAVKEGNSASTELQRIREHNDKMQLELKKMEQKGNKAIPTLQDAIDRLNKKDVVDE